MVVVRSGAWFGKRISLGFHHGTGTKIIDLVLLLVEWSV